MNFFRKKKVAPNRSRSSQIASSSGEDFYVQHSGEVPLDDFSDVRGINQYRRTSQHSPARRRENSNRASNWALGKLLLKALLGVVALVGGFILLKVVLGRMAEPTEKEMQRWEENARLMEVPSKSAITIHTPVSQEIVVSTELIQSRLDRWEKAGQFFRSAESLHFSGVDAQAIEQLGQGLRLMPDNRAAQRMLVDLYMKAGLYAEAVPLCIRLLDQDSGQQDIRNYLMKSLMESGQIDAGLTLVDRILLDQPDNLNALSLAAEGRMKLGDQEKSLTLFQHILKLDAKNQTALIGSGEIYVAAGEYSNAVPCYLELAKLDSQPEYYQQLTRCYAQLNEAGRTVVAMGQAASLFGSATVSPWLRDPLYDPVRESVDFRSFADRLVGIETRKAIEALSKRETERTEPAAAGALDRPAKPELNVLRPGQ